jgi:hypothetical protein
MGGSGEEGGRKGKERKRVDMKRKKKIEGGKRCTREQSKREGGREDASGVKHNICVEERVDKRSAVRGVSSQNCKAWSVCAQAQARAPVRGVRAQNARPCVVRPRK